MQAILTNQRWAMQVAYLGTRYAGWQAQGNTDLTVQTQVERALSKIANVPIAVVCAGRTDAGVHAEGQVIHFDSPVLRSQNAWLAGGNIALPSDISFKSAIAVPSDFHARYTATARRYRYVILNQNTRDCWWQTRSWLVHYPLDHEAMHEAAQDLLGEQNFSSFRAVGCQSRTPMRNMHHISVFRPVDFPNQIHIELEANAFVHHMVRNIVGSLVLIGRGVKPIDWLRELLAIKDRNQAGMTAPPQGLAFLTARYPQRFGVV